MEIASRNSNVLCLGNASELAGMLEALRRSQVSSLIPLSDRISLYNTMRGPTDDDPRCTLYPVRTPLINPREVLIPPYKTGETADHYMSTMYFVQDLTDISIKLLRADNKKERLVEALQDINSKLPAAAYLPFDKSFTRECAVLHIPISEVKVFKTKERAPFLICIEIYKPFDELQARYHEEASESMCSLSGSEEEAAPAVPTSRRASVLVSSNLTYGNYQQIMSEATQQVRLSHGIFPRVRAESLIEAESPLMEIEEEDKEDDAKMLDEHYSNHVIAGAIGTHTKAAHSSVNVRQTIAYVYGEQSDQPQQQSSPSDFHHTRNVFGESAKEQKERLKRRSPFGHFRTWNVISIIVKSGDDLKQEQLAMQLISQFHQIFRQSKLNLWLRPYEILATGPDCGILECVTDAMSIDSLKKSMPGSLTSLSDFFIWQFGGEKAPAYKAARKSFVESFAAYSLVCYILQIKDRHNGNILLDNQGHVIHIDFGFLISNSPGKGIKFEQAPFKLTNEFVNVMGGVRSSLFLHFRKLCVKGFIALRRNQQKIWILLEMMRTGSGASLSCFMGGEQAMLDLRERFNPREEMSSSDCREYINRLIDESLDHWTTRWYDRYQRWCQNIL